MNDKEVPGGKPWNELNHNTTINAAKVFNYWGV